MNAGPIVITGGSGLLALNWACRFRASSDVVLLTHKHPVLLRGVRTQRSSLEDPVVVTNLLADLSPSVVVHTAGLTSVDQCERDPGAAWLANVAVARNVALAARACGASLVHVSTDHLFQGNQPFRSESHEPHPLNVYGRTKLEAEHEVIFAHPEALVVRTNFFGWGHRYRQSFSDRIIFALEAGLPIRMFDDSFFTPVLCDVLAEICMRLVQRGTSGVLNVAGEDRLSKYEFALRLSRAFGLPENLVLRGTIKDANLDAPRPPDMSLDSSLARTKLGTGIGGVDNFIEALRLQQLGGRREEFREAVEA